MFMYSTLSFCKLFNVEKKCNRVCPRITLTLITTQRILQDGQAYEQNYNKKYLQLHSMEMVPRCTKPKAFTSLVTNLYINILYNQMKSYDCEKKCVISSCKGRILNRDENLEIIQHNILILLMRKTKAQRIKFPFTRTPNHLVSESELGPAKTDF